MISLSTLLVLSFFFHSGESSHNRDEERKQVRVTSILSKPFLMQEYNQDTGTYGYRGFIPDILASLEYYLHKNFTISLVKDGWYGMQQNDGMWNGMIGEVIKEEADMAAGPLTVTASRLNVVDMVHYMHLCRVVLVKRSRHHRTTLGDLLRDRSFRFGVVESGSTLQFIRMSIDEEISMIRQRIEPVRSFSEGVAKVRESVDGSFGFVIESTAAEYELSREPCDQLTIVRIPQWVMSEYGFALGVRSQVKDEIEKGIELMKISGEIDTLKRKWWSGFCPENIVKSCSC